MPIPKSPHPFVSATGTLLLVVIAFASGIIAVPFMKGMQFMETASVAEALSSKLSIDPSALVAKAAIVYDPTTQKVLFEKNAYEVLPLASLTKLITATAILNNTTGNPTITITKDHLVEDGAQADANFSTGDRISLRNLLNIGLIASSNDAMQAAATVLGPKFTQVMQATAFSLGLKDMQFNNATGLDINATTAGGYGSAYDMAVITSNFAAHYPQYFNLTQKTGITIPAGYGGTISAEATTLPLQYIPGFVGAKTGYTTLAGGNVVSMFDIEVGHPLVIVIIGSTTDGRFADTETLIQAAREAQHNAI